VITNYPIKYFVRDSGETIEDSIQTDVTWEGEDLGFIAELVANYAWDNNDGWEWLKFGAIIVLVTDRGHGLEELGDFEITVDYSPDFYAKSVKKEREK